jgi:hypothetical protein
VDEAERRNTQLEMKIKKLEKENINSLTTFYEEMENRNLRKQNIIISGITEESNGSAKERMAADEMSVKTILENVIELEENSITRMHRIGRPAPGKSRLVCVTMNDETVKKKILSNAKQLRDKSKYRTIYINPDRTKLQQEEMRNLRNELKQRRENGEEAVIYRNKVVLKREITNFQE